VTLSAALGVGSQTVVFERRSGAKWVRIGTALTGTNGAATLSVKPYGHAKTTYRARFEATSAYPASTSGSVVVTPRVYLTKGNAPKTMLKGKAKTLTGYLKARHAAGSKVVRIYRYKKTSGGKWKMYGHTHARIADYRSYSKYTTSFKLPSKGKWRICAYMPADSMHAATYSTYDYTTVK
jgi:hypothetical protein